MRNLFSKIQFFFSPRLKTEGKENLQRLQHALTHGGIEFSFKKVTDEDGTYVIAQSLNTPGKYIVTSGRDIAELDRNIKDAIFTAFQVPAQYCDDALISSPLIPEQEVTLKYATA